MHTILINKDNTVVTSVRKNVTHKSSMFNELHILTDEFYQENGETLNMRNFTCEIEYILPVSREYITEVLTLSEKLYKERLEYFLPMDTIINSEPGDVEFKFRFTRHDIATDGSVIDKTRVTYSCILYVASTEILDDYIPPTTPVLPGDVVYPNVIETINKNREIIVSHIATDHDFSSADNALKLELENQINLKADSSVIENIDYRVEVAEDKVEIVEDKVKLVEGKMKSVETRFATLSEEVYGVFDVVDSKVEQKDYNAKITSMEDVDSNLNERLQEVESKFEEGEGSVSDLISDAKTKVLETAATDAKSKANLAEENAKTYAHGLSSAIQEDVDDAVDRIIANEEAIAKNKSAIEEFTAISATDIEGIFKNF